MTKKFTTDGASDYLEKEHGIRRAPATLRKLRLVGGGPFFYRLSGNTVLYSAEDLDRWVEERLTKHASTASYNEAAE